LQLSTELDPALASLAPPDYAVGIIAGCRTIDPIASTFILPRPNDGRVSVESSKLANMTDHVTIKACHSGLTVHRDAIEQTVAFLHTGRFNRLEAQGRHSFTP
jgi:hypothetical protein